MRIANPALSIAVDGPHVEWELEWGAASVTGRVRAENQDTLLIWVSHGATADGKTGHRFNDSARRVFAAAVADGMGGVAGGGEASRLVVATARAELDRVGAEPPALLLSGIAEKCRSAVIARSRDCGFPGMGSTLTLVFLSSGAAHLLHVGDSRCYRIRALPPEIRLWSRDHNLLSEWIAEGRVTPGQAAGHPGRHMLTQAISDNPRFEPQIESIPLTADEQTLLVCSDGLHGVLSDAEILDAVKAAPAALQPIVDGLIAKADSRGSPDNVSVILARVRPIA